MVYPLHIAGLDRELPLGRGDYTAGRIFRLERV